jgi:hypothetical protein
MSCRSSLLLVGATSLAVLTGGYGALAESSGSGAVPAAATGEPGRALGGGAGGGGDLPVLADGIPFTEEQIAALGQVCQTVYESSHVQARVFADLGADPGMAALRAGRAMDTGTLEQTWGLAQEQSRANLTSLVALRIGAGIVATTPGADPEAQREATAVLPDMDRVIAIQQTIEQILAGPSSVEALIDAFLTMAEFEEIPSFAGGNPTASMDQYLAEVVPGC